MWRDAPTQPFAARGGGGGTLWDASSSSTCGAVLANVIGGMRRLSRSPRVRRRLNAVGCELVVDAWCRARKRHRRDAPAQPFAARGGGG